MTPAEAASLLARCAAFDNRKPSAIAAEAWSAALHDIPLDRDAFAAVDRFYGDTGPTTNGDDRRWIQPHNVRRIRSDIRSRRLENFQYVPSGPEESAALYLRRLKAQQEEVASGRRPAELPAAQKPNNGPIEGRVLRAVDDPHDEGENHGAAS